MSRNGGWSEGSGSKKIECTVLCHKYLTRISVYIFSRQLLQQVPKFHINPSLTKQVAKDASSWKSFHSSLRVAELKAAERTTSQTAKNAAKVRALLFGSGGVSLGLVARSLQQRCYKVQCEGNRLAGVIQRTLQQEDGKFDWKRFWSYLQPHLWEFLGAIAVSH